MTDCHGEVSGTALLMIDVVDIGTGKVNCIGRGGYAVGLYMKCIMCPPGFGAQEESYWVKYCILSYAIRYIGNESKT